ncbi:MAG: RNA repair domain-containing protein [Candidatus Thermoplasmatota archaeon]
MRKAREVLNELRWREGRNLRGAELWVRGRGVDLKVIGGDEIVELGRRYFSTATATIPYYKVVRIVYEDEILFARSQQ